MRKKLKEILNTIGYISLGIILFQGATYADTTITFMTINDVYSLSGTDDWGDVARLKTAIDTETRSAKHTILTVNGDFLGPSPASLKTYGKHVTDILEAIGINYVVPGNHEFDFGLPALQSIINSSKLEWFGSNIISNGRLLPGIQNYKIVEIDGIKIGLFGVCTPETKNLSNPGPSVIFKPTIPTAKDVVTKLLEGGAEVIIALTHQSLEEDIDLAREVKRINLILGGHDHFPVTLMRYGTLIHKSGHDARYLGRIDLKIIKAEQKIIIVPSWKMVPIYNHIEQHSDIAKKVGLSLNDTEDDWLNHVVEVSKDLDLRQDTVRTQENGLGNLVADFVRSDLNADCALLNAGYFRGEAIYEAGSKLKLSDFTKILPFTDEVVLIEVTGQQLLDTLEHTLSSCPKAAKTFPHVSGMAITYDSRKPVGKRLIKVTVKGKPLDPTTRYRLATLDFLYNGGDGFSALKNASLLKAEAHQSGPVGTQFAKLLSTQEKLNVKIDKRVLDQSKI